MRHFCLAFALVALAGCGSSEALRSHEAVGTPPVAVAPPPGPLALRYTEVAQRIQSHALGHRDAFAKLTVLADDVGHRLSGSKALDDAIAWAVLELERDGHENVHTEKVMVPVWRRGIERAALLEPHSDSVPVLGLGGTIATPDGGVVGDVVVVRSFDELAQRAEEVSGAVVLYDVALPPYDEEKGSGYGDVVKYRSEGPSRAAALGAKAVLMRSVTAKSLSTLHTGALRYQDSAPKIPAAAITTEDADRIARYASRGKRVRIRLELDSQKLADVESANVVAELTGSELPEEIVLLGAHLDSWDVGQGAHDDGAGCTMIMQALTDLRNLGLRPRRTIRVVLFTNEENGLEGAKAYARAHHDELGRIVAAFEADLGGFAPRGLNVEIPDTRAAVIMPRMKDLLSLTASLGADRAVVEKSGADLIPLVKSGVLGLGLVTDHASYFDLHHTEADTLDKVDPADLAKNAAFVATIAYAIADAPARLDAP